VKKIQRIKVIVLPYVIATLSFLSANSGFAEDNIINQAKRFYLDASYEEAITLISSLDASQRSDEQKRLLGLCYFETLEFSKAKPLVSAVFEKNKNDTPLVFAISQILLNDKKYEKAISVLNSHEPTNADSKAKKNQLLGRSYLALNKPIDAIENLKTSNQSEKNYELQNAVYLAMAYQALGKDQSSLSVIEKSISANQDHFETARLRFIKDKINQRYQGNFSVNLSTRSEYDTNAVLKPKDEAVILDVSGKSDKRQTFSGDLSYQKPITRSLKLSTEAHFYHSIHEDLNSFDSSILNVGISSIWRKSPWVFRTPLEITAVYKDGTKYSTHFTASPGLSYIAQSQWLVHTFLKYQRNNYDENKGQVEDKNGAYAGVGLFVSKPIINKDSLIRMILEWGKDNTDGKNWEREEISAIINSEIHWKKIRLDLGLQYLKQDFANLNHPTLEERKDNAYWLTGGIAYEVFKHWELQLSATLESHSSSLSFYEYDRTVIAGGISWKL